MIDFVSMKNFQSLQYANVHRDSQRGGFEMECSLHMSDRRPRPGHRPPSGKAGVCEEEQVNISCLCLPWEQELH